MVKQAEILDGVGIETAPPLKGYVRFIAKPTAEMILSIDRKDPLLVRWQYGLGRAAVFASDARPAGPRNGSVGRASTSSGPTCSATCCPMPRPARRTLEYDSANGDLVAAYKLGPGVEDPPQAPEIFVFGPDGFRQPIEVKKIAQGAFREAYPSAAARVCSARGPSRIRERSPRPACTVQKPSWMTTGRMKPC